MDIKHAVDMYPLPPMSYLDSVVIYTHGHPREDPTSLPVRCTRVEPRDLLRCRETPATGRPVLMALLPDPTGGCALALYPCPDRDTYAVVRYAPPLVEI